MRSACLTALFCLLATSSSTARTGNLARTEHLAKTETVARTETCNNQLPKNTVLYGVGYTNQYDSYLSPAEYTGVQLDLLYVRNRLLQGGRKSNKTTLPHITHQSLLDIQLHTSTPETQFPRLYGADIHYDAGWYYNWWHVGTPRLSMKLGGQVGGTLGGIYANRASNNPANAHAALRTSLSAGAQYALPLRRTQLTFRYQADLPLIGAAFSPDYGQSYYELSQHGYSRNICFTSFTQAFSIRQLALMDICLRRCTLTVGYKADIRQAKLNHLRQHQYAHSFMIGWKKHF